MQNPIRISLVACKCLQVVSEICKILLQLQVSVVQVSFPNVWLVYVKVEVKKIYCHLDVWL